MPKVVTNAGTQEFPAKSEGKSEKVDAPKLEVAPPPKVTPAPEEKAVTPPPPTPEEEGLEPDDVDLTEHVRKKINKKHRQMKEAQEAAQDAETFAKTQYDRARLAEQRAAELERQLQELNKAPPAKEPELKQPTVKDFTDEKGQVRWEEYTQAVAKYAADKALTDKEAKDREAQQKAAQEKDAAERAEAAKRFQEKADKIDGFQDRMAKATVWFPNAVLEYITESDNGPEIAVYLAEHPETAERISKLRPIKAIAEIGKLKLTEDKPEAKAPTPPVLERGGAPPPITPVSGAAAGTVNTDPSKMSFKELREYERARRQKR